MIFHTNLPNSFHNPLRDKIAKLHYKQICIKQTKYHSIPMDKLFRCCFSVLKK